MPDCKDLVRNWVIGTDEAGISLPAESALAYSLGKIGNRDKPKRSLKLRNSTMRSLPPKHYELLPLLEAPAAYICVIRDIDSDSFRIDGADHPATFIGAIMDEDERAFGIELVSILETEDLGKSESALFERHHARLSAERLDLDELQLEETRRSVMQIDAHRSLYLTPQQTGPSTTARPQAKSSYETLVSSYLGAPGRKKWRERRRSRQSSLFKSYGAEALLRSKPAAQNKGQPSH